MSTKTTDVRNCDIKDDTGLNDFQKLPDDSGIAIPKVGIERFRLPMSYRHEGGKVLNHDTEASAFCNLASNKTGVNMSRFCHILQDESDKAEVSPKMILKVLKRFKLDLRDFDTEAPIQNVSLKLKFKYPMKQSSLKSNNWGWQYYTCQWSGELNDAGKFTCKLKLNYEYSSTCPCSLSMSKQYEEDYRSGKTTEGNGIAAAHGQRSKCTTIITLNEHTGFSIEDLVYLLRQAIPTETQSLVKRVDEQAFAILNGNYPLFVEHASRRLAKVLNVEERILDWEASFEHFESLHSHNAVAYINKAASLH